jgi:hypothetical protein
MMTEQQTVTPFISLDEAVLRIHRKWERVIDAQQKVHSARVECGMDLLALRARIETGEAGAISWWNWYQQKFTRSRASTRRVMMPTYQWRSILLRAARGALSR